MRSKRFWLAASVIAGLAFVGQADRLPADAPSETGASARTAGGKCNKSSQVRADGQRGDRGKAFADDQGGGKAGKGRKGKGGKGGQFAGGKGKGRGQSLSADQIVDRLMAFDKNGDGKLTKDELPERMQNLIARGDTNKDNALDRDEVKKLAGELSRDGFAFGGFGGFGRGGFGGGRGPGGFGGPGGRGPGGAGRGLDATLADLKLSDKAKDKAEALVKAHQENVSKLMGLARADLLLKMKDVLNDADYKKFKEALERQPGPGAAPAAAAPANLERRLDALQKEIEALRRELKR